MRCPPQANGRSAAQTPPDDMCHQTTGRPATQPPDSDDMCPHRQRPPDDRRQQANGRPCSAGRGAAKFTPIYCIHAYFMGCLPGIYSVKRYSRRILGFFCRNSARFSRCFGPQMGQIGVICRRARQLCDICQQTNGRPCGTVLNWPLAAPAPAPGCRATFIRVRFIPVACDRSQGKCPARYMAVRAFSRSLGVYGICTEMYGFCTVFVRFCPEKRRKTGKNRHVRAAQGSARRPLRRSHPVTFGRYGFHRKPK